LLSDERLRDLPDSAISRVLIESMLRVNTRIFQAKARRKKEVRNWDRSTPSAPPAAAAQPAVKPPSPWASAGTGVAPFRRLIE